MNKNKKKSDDLFVTVKPKSSLISPFISYYYFHSSTNDGFNKSYTFYPNFKHALTIYKNSDVDLNEVASIVIPSKQKKLDALYCINKDKSMKVSIKGAFNKIGIVFNPLGINHFIEKPLDDLYQYRVQIIGELREGFYEMLETVFSENNYEKKGTLLDTYFESKVCRFEQELLKNAIHELIVSNGGTTVSELSQKFYVNRKTLLRLFKKHTKMTIEEYRRMVMFRQALNYSQQNKELSNLTEVAMFSMYYDQNHFIKHFKAITKETPKSFLNKLSKIGSEDTYWNFKD